eukprot:scaffold21979_cov66-Phaeocystis_antarctica.AAC.6
MKQPVWVSFSPEFSHPSAAASSPAAYTPPSPPPSPPAPHERASRPAAALWRAPRPTASPSEAPPVAAGPRRWVGGRRRTRSPSRPRRGRSALPAPTSAALAPRGSRRPGRTAYARGRRGARVHTRSSTTPPTTTPPAPRPPGSPRRHHAHRPARHRPPRPARGSSRPRSRERC